MTILKIHQSGQPILRHKSVKVSKSLLAKKETQSLIDAMIETLRDAPGVGLAAPQVGQSMQIVIVEDKAEYHEQVPKHVLNAQGRRPIPLTVLINPQLEIIDSENEFFFEGCLSVDGYVAVVPRAKKVRLKALDRAGMPVEIIATGWHARILQHEVDHLRGFLCVDSMITSSFMTVKNFNMLWRKAAPADIIEKFSNRSLGL